MPASKRLKTSRNRFTAWRTQKRGLATRGLSVERSWIRVVAERAMLGMERNVERLAQFSPVMALGWLANTNCSRRLHIRDLSCMLRSMCRSQRSNLPHIKSCRIRYGHPLLFVIDLTSSRFSHMSVIDVLLLLLRPSCLTSVGELSREPIERID